jgi:hypothetical protein
MIDATFRLLAATWCCILSAMKRRSWRGNDMVR